MKFETKLPCLAAALISVVSLPGAGAPAGCGSPTATLLVGGLHDALGSTVGPGGALYVTERATGTIWRIDPDSGETTVFASGLPKDIVGVGGVMDVAFIGNTAYALVTL